MTENDTPEVLAVEKVVKKILKLKPQKIISLGTYDQKYIARIGHLHDSIAYCPGILDLAHQPDENVVIEDMTNS